MQLDFTALTLGPVCYQLKVAERWYEPEAGYAGFLHEQEAAKFSVIIQPADVRDKQRSSAATPLFDTQNTWRVFQRQDGMLDIEIPAPHAQAPHITCSLHPAAGEVPVALDIIRPHIKRMSDERSYVFNPLHYPLDQLLFIHQLPLHHSLLMHAVGGQVEGRGFAAVGRSGAGKSTLAGHLVSRDVTLFSDDRIIIHAAEGGDAPWMYGSPWPGEGGQAVNDFCNLHALYVLGRGPNEFTQCSPLEAIKHVSGLLSVPWYHQEIAIEALRVLEHIFAQVPCYLFNCANETAAADALMEHVLRDSA